MRAVFYPMPGHTTGGRSMRVRSQAADPEYGAYVENVRFHRNRVIFATVHVVGSRNGLEPWSGLPDGDRPSARTAEVAAREAAALSWIDAAFDAATNQNAAGVLLLLQAEPVESEPGYARIRDRIVRRATDFGRPVLLVHGDEHVFEQQPFLRRRTEPHSARNVRRHRPKLAPRPRQSQLEGSLLLDTRHRPMSVTRRAVLMFS